MAKRAYKSEVRDAQAEQTRQGLLDATHALLIEMPVEDISIPKVAKRAGVSAPTAYRYFPSLDDLFRAFVDSIRPQLGLDSGGIRQLTPSRAPDVTVGYYRRFERHSKLLRRLMDSPTWQRIRLGDRQDRAALLIDEFQRLAPDLDERDLRVAMGAIMVFVSPSTWRWLREIWGLNARDTARAAHFAMSNLITAIENRTSLDEPGDET